MSKPLPSEVARAAHDCNVDNGLTATFQTLDTASLTVSGGTPARDAALTTPSTERAWTNGFSLAASFECEFSNIPRSYARGGTVRYAW